MSAREEIVHLMNRYVFTFDTGDINEFAELFEHGEWAVEGTPSRLGKQGALDMFANIKLYADGTPKTKHLMSNVDLRIDETAGTASSECYITVLQQTPNFPLQTIFCGHYFDNFERVGDHWRFAKRVIRSPLVGDLSAHVKELSSVVAED